MLPINGENRRKTDKKKNTKTKKYHIYKQKSSTHMLHLSIIVP